MNTINETRERLAIASAFTGAAALLTEGAIELAWQFFGVSHAYRVTETLFAVGMLLTLGGIVELRDRRRPATRPAKAGFAIFAAGQALLGVIALASAMRGANVLDPLFPLGALSWLAGSVTIGVTALRAGGALRWLSAALPVVVLATFGIGDGGFVVFGAYWLVAAGVMAAAPSTQSARAY